MKSQPRTLWCYFLCFGILGVLAGEAQANEFDYTFISRTVSTSSFSTNPLTGEIVSPIDGDGSSDPGLFNHTYNTVADVTGGHADGHVNLNSDMASHYIFFQSQVSSTASYDPLSNLIGSSDALGTAQIKADIFIKRGIGVRIVGVMQNASSNAELVMKVEGEPNNIVFSFSSDSQELLNIDEIFVVDEGNYSIDIGIQAFSRAIGGTLEAADSGMIDILVQALIPGDANLDGTVNIADLSKLASRFGRSDQDWTTGDFNGDGLINIADLSKLASNFSKSAIINPPAGPAAIMGGGSSMSVLVPEPGMMTVLLCMGAGLVRRRR